MLQCRPDEKPHLDGTDGTDLIPRQKVERAFATRGLLERAHGVEIEPESVARAMSASRHLPQKRVRHQVTTCSESRKVAVAVILSAIGADRA